VNSTRTDGGKLKGPRSFPSTHKNNNNNKKISRGKAVKKYINKYSTKKMGRSKKDFKKNIIITITSNVTITMC